MHCGQTVAPFEAFVVSMECALHPVKAIQYHTSTNEENPRLQLDLCCT